MTAIACTAAAAVILGYAAVGPGRRAYLRRAARYHYSRLRYARRMRGPLPARDQGVPYSRRAWLAILDAWETGAARPERTRT